MQRAAIKTTLAGIFSEVFGQPKLEVREEMTAADIENWDSLNHVTMIFATEKKFGITFSTREVQGLKNVGELIALIEQKTA